MTVLARDRFKDLVPASRKRGDSPLRWPARLLLALVLASSAACRNLAKVEQGLARPAAGAAQAAGKGFTPGVVTCPAGTAEIDCMSATEGEGVALASIRDSASSKFAVWQLDLRSHEWTRLTEARFKYPAAVARSPNALLVVDPARHGAIAHVIRDGEETTHRLGPGLPRGGLFEPRTESWWIGGVFLREEGKFLAAEVARDGAVTYHVEAPPESWLGLSRSEFTGLVVDETALRVTSPGSCELLHVDRTTGATTRSCSLATASASLHLACESTLQESSSSDQVTQVAENFDWPVRLWDLGGTSAVLIRLAGRRAWKVCTFDPECVPGPSAQLPFDHQPFALTTRWALVHRRDLTEPGSPDHVEIVDLEGFFAQWGSDQSAQLAAPPPEFVVSSAGAWPGDRVLVVDGKRCIGDAIRDLHHARSEDRLEPETYRLLVTGNVDEGRCRMIARSLAPHVRLDSEVAHWEASVPVETVALGPAVQLATTESPRR